MKQAETAKIKRARNSRPMRVVLFLVLSLALFLVLSQEILAAGFVFPSVQLGVQKGENPGDISVLLQIVFPS